jgi:hypothetical protein
MYRRRGWQRGAPASAVMRTRLARALQRFRTGAGVSGPARLFRNGALYAERLVSALRGARPFQRLMADADVRVEWLESAGSGSGSFKPLVCRNVRVSVALGEATGAPLLVLGTKPKEVRSARCANAVAPTPC